MLQNNFKNIVFVTNNKRVFFSSNSDLNKFIALWQSRRVPGYQIDRLNLQNCNKNFVWAGMCR
jgi:hypothetical protein